MNDVASSAIALLLRDAQQGLDSEPGGPDDAVRGRSTRAPMISMVENRELPHILDRLPGVRHARRVLDSHTHLHIFSDTRPRHENAAIPVLCRYDPADHSTRMYVAAAGTDLWHRVASHCEEWEAAGRARPDHWSTPPLPSWRRARRSAAALAVTLTRVFGVPVAVPWRPRHRGFSVLWLDGPSVDAMRRCATQCRSARQLSYSKRIIWERRTL